MAEFVDFRSAVNLWGQMGPDVKRRIKEQFETLSDNLLEELFRRNPDAKRLYGLAVGFRPPPVVAAPPTPPPAPVFWSLELERELKAAFRTILRKRGVTEAAIDRAVRDELNPRLDEVRRLKTKEEMIRLVEHLATTVAPEFLPKRPPTPPRVTPPEGPPLVFIPIEVFPWDFFDWLRLTKGKTMNDWTRMMEDEKFLLKDQYKREVDEYIRKQKERGLL